LDLLYLLHAPRACVARHHQDHIIMIVFVLAIANFDKTIVDW
jgi:hypothetical protein